MKKINIKLSSDEFELLGIPMTTSMQKRITEDEIYQVKQYRLTKGRVKRRSPEEMLTPASQMSAYTTDGKLMTIDEYCFCYGIDRAQVKSFKLISHSSTPYYNIQSSNVGLDESEEYLELIRESVKKDLSSLTYKPVKTKSKDKIIVVSIADLHFGAYIDNLSKTKPYSISILADLLSESADLINEYEAKEVHVRVLGDLIESFTGLNHINSWKGLHKGMIGAEVVKLTTKVLHDNFFSRIKNLKNIGVIAGNHDRVTSNKAEDSDGDAANLIAWGLDLIGYDVKFDPFVLTEVIDGINYIDLHGHDFISRKSTKDICWDYGKQGVFNFIREGHLHSIIEKLSATQVNKFQTVKDDAIDHRRMNIPSFFTGNSYSERLGYTSNSGFIVSYNNGKGVPNVDFKAL